MVLLVVRVGPFWTSGSTLCPVFSVDSLSLPHVRVGFPSSGLTGTDQSRYDLPKSGL